MLWKTTYQESPYESTGQYGVYVWHRFFGRCQTGWQVVPIACHPDGEKRMDAFLAFIRQPRRFAAVERRAKELGFRLDKV